VDTADLRQLERVLAIVRGVMSDQSVGAYVHGSCALDRLQHTSDLDVLVVSTRRPAVRTRHLLVTRLLEVSGRRAPTPGRPVELSVVAIDDITPWTFPPTSSFMYGEWLRGSYERGYVPGRVVSPDLALLIHSARQSTRSLFGPAPDELLPFVPEDDLVRATLNGIDALLDEVVGDERNVLLTFARMLTTVETGRVVSKDEAAHVAATCLGARHRTVLIDAADDYLGRHLHDWTARESEVKACIEDIVRELRRDEARSHPTP
jgi:predicted nucleotidyltransferase